MGHQQGRIPIGPKDVVTIHGRYLHKGQEKNRFFIKGIGFPIPPPSPKKIDIDGWIAVLEQLAEDTDINAIRVYDMDCHNVKDIYDPFLKRAAKLGIYVIVPLTNSSGDGNLSRDKDPPDCYPRKLFEYGKFCIDQYWNHPNVIMGVVGNEVMNNFATYKSAPCVKSYLNDLAAYSQSKASHWLFPSKRTSFPLMYATQHDSPSAELLPDEAIKLTLDYLSCRTESSSDLDFAFGINIESWCSSSETFEFEDDGVTESSYHSLWMTFAGKNKTTLVVDAVTGESTPKDVPPVSPYPVTIPIFFSEMGCSKKDFNRDNPLVPPGQKHIRDWKQIPLVSSEEGPMADLWSGFVAYAYDGGGSNYFRMMGGDSSKWNGKDTLPSSKEYDNFRHGLEKVGKGTLLEGGDGSESSVTAKGSAISCGEAVAQIQTYFGLDLYPLAQMPSHFSDGIDLRTTNAPTGAATSVINTDNTSSTTNLFVHSDNPMLLFSMLALLISGVFYVTKKSRGSKRNGYAAPDNSFCIGDSAGNEKDNEEKSFLDRLSFTNYGAA